MIMPRINSASACEKGGSLGLVDGGSVLLRSPGAPGWTTTGAPGSGCCAATPKQTKFAAGLVARNTAQKAANAPADRSLRPWRNRCSRWFGTLLNIFIASPRQAGHEILTLSNSFQEQGIGLRDAFAPRGSGSRDFCSELTFPESFTAVLECKR